MKKIGGDFPITTEILLGSKVNDLKEYTQKYKNVIWTNLGRSAISLAISDIVLKGGGRKVFLPSYICPSVINTFESLGIEIEYYFYCIKTSKFEGIPKKLNNNIFFLVHYFGKKNDSLLRMCKELYSEDGYIIEDCVQAAFTELPPLKERYYRIYSYRKFTEVLDGALLVSYSPLEVEVDGNISNSLFVKSQLIGKVLKGLDLNETYYLDRLKSSEGSLALKNQPTQMSDLSKYILERLNIDYIKKQRQSNWILLNELLQKSTLLINYIKPLYNSIDIEEIPLGYVICTKYRDELRSYLIDNSIYCPVHWDLPVIHYSEDKHLSKSILMIVIDQRVSNEEVFLIFNKIEKFFKEFIK